jgi:ABC-type multidrug transport system fused ATPase/permease subunit
MNVAAKFSEAARGIEQLIENKPFSINLKEEKTRCEKCKRLLPEKDGICPACVNRNKTLWRVASYLKPYKGRAIALALLSIATTAINLVPPTIQGELIDRVLEPRSDVGLLPQLIGLWLLAMLTGVILQVVSARLTTWLAGHIATDLRAGVYRAVEFLQLQFFDKKQVGANHQSRHAGHRPCLGISGRRAAVLAVECAARDRCDGAFAAHQLAIGARGDVAAANCGFSGHVLLGSHDNALWSRFVALEPLSHPSQRGAHRHSRRESLRAGRPRKREIYPSQHAIESGGHRGRQLLEHRVWRHEFLHRLWARSFTGAWAVISFIAANCRSVIFGALTLIWA